MSILVFFIVVSLILFITTPFKFKAHISYNVLKNKGIVKFYFFKLNFLTLKVKIKPKYLLFTTKKGKVILIPFDEKQQQNVEYVDLSLILFDKTTINTLKISLNVGVKNSPFYTALLYGLFSTINSIILSILKTKKLNVIVSNKIIPVYTKDSTIVKMNSSLSFSFFDYLWGVLLYLLNIKKVGKHYEARWN